MKAIRTVKLKITSENPEFSEVAASYKDAANWLSLIVFKQRKPSTPAKLSRHFYGTVRQKFQLPSQVTCSLFRHVVATYRSMKSNGEWELAVYKKLNVPICWKRDFNLTSKGILTVWGTPVTYQSRELPTGKWSDSKLKYFNHQWYLCLTIEVEVPEPKTTGTVVGVDSGIKNLLTATDRQSNKTLYISGSVLNHRRLAPQDS
ncbi:MAG: transposase [Candidatus Competibacteraceae bacterium]|nr:transposase [Candidatus Competibacteraceae bacterium]